MEVVLDNNYFSFRSQPFKQISGLPKGNCISGVLSSVYMDSIIEERSLHQLNIALFHRYVDDCFCLTTNEEEARAIFNTLNIQNKHIKFDIELPERDGSLSLLDFSVRFQQGRPIFSFYKKNAKKPIFMHYKSAVPLTVKENCIKNELKRIDERCSEAMSKESHHKEFMEILKMNSYPEKVIENWTKKKKHSNKNTKTARKNNGNEFVYFRFPFVNDKIQRKVQSIFKKNELPIRVYDKNFTLRNALSNKDDPTACKLANCTMNSKLCHTKMCVYQLQCNKCHQNYIGSTVRPLHTRVMEHMRSENSSVFQHKRQCDHTFAVNVIGKARDSTSLRFKEALLIQQRQPDINAKRESDELVSLTFG